MRLPGLFQVPGRGVASECRIGAGERCRGPAADRRRGCDRAGERRKELQERAPDRQAAGDMLPLATRPAGIYLAAGATSRINARGSTRLIRFTRDPRLREEEREGEEGEKEREREEGRRGIGERVKEAEDGEQTGV